jgi:hypothetical protein
LETAEVKQPPPCEHHDPLVDEKVMLLEVDPRLPPPRHDRAVARKPMSASERLGLIDALDELLASGEAADDIGQHKGQTYVNWTVRAA